MDDLLRNHLEFSPWYFWENRQKILKGAPEGTLTPGVYCIAFSNQLKEGNPMNWEKVMYIGMSARDDGLTGRWRDLDRALGGNRGHSGGNAVVERLECVRTTAGGWRAGGRRVLVSAMVVPVSKDLPYPEKIRQKGRVAYLEYEAFAQFFVARNKLKPRYNTGGSGRKGLSGTGNGPE